MADRAMNCDLYSHMVVFYFRFYRFNPTLSTPFAFLDSPCQGEDRPKDCSYYEPCD
jgi:hypothetical protein